jgi:hypothetical protein
MLAWCGVQGEGMQNVEVVRECIARGVIAEAVPILIEKMNDNYDYQVIIAGYSLGKLYKAMLFISFFFRRWCCPASVSRTRAWSLSQPPPSQQYHHPGLRVTSSVHLQAQYSCHQQSSTDPECR